MIRQILSSRRKLMRKSVDLNQKWAFTKQCTKPPEKMPQDWIWVDLPHCWNDIDGQDGGNDYYRGRCFYAKELEKSEIPAADKYYLEILAANSSAQVYVNGRMLGSHDGGYSLWRVEITSALKEKNLIVIAVDNSPNDRVYPQVADFTFYGGLYRGVRLICTAQSHFELEYYGGNGLKISPRIKGRSALVEIEAFINGRKSGQRIRYSVFSDEGSFQTETEESRAVMEIPDVHLWHGRRDPFLYTARVELMENGECIDMVSSRFGCRSFEIDPEKGFILNGEEYPLRGVSRHQDRKGIGNALRPEHHRQDIELICEMGCTTVRLAHYQHDSYFYELCDEHGLVVWAEIPYISQHMPGGRENSASQMKELIIQNYNHPCIVVWGLSNEITMKGDRDPDMLENHRMLNELCHSLDKTRLTAIAAVSPCPIDSPYIKIPDVVSYNHYFGWYGGDTSMNGPWFDRFHEQHPDIPIGCSEYGCEALDWHSGAPEQGDYTEEYQAFYHEELIKQLFSRKYLWATHVWNMFDFGADARNEGGENGQNHKGLVTFDREYRKDSFYAYKAWLSDEPMIHLCGKRYVNRCEDPARVTVYSNQPEVELFANGISLGKKKAEDHFFRFEVPNRGETKLLAVAGELSDGGEIRKTDKPDERYIFREKSAVLNWFDIKQPEGYFSLNDSVGDIRSTDEGKRLLDVILSGVFSGERGGFELGGDMLEMMNGFKLLRLVGMLGSMNISFSKQQLLELNEKLNRIPKQ